ncbi:efflux RND transporter periplasmic adaptor subunit [Epilithonimonas ginsengisoli]|uniref:Efflux RND transporter periplasmic adaptor subunit n=3 Tax=Chryseobacterium group TaxID=2782232 RepID=A0ABU4JJT4_9FLAO|nr:MULTISPECIES: efflux RND transporter periplasmic adaptor subunit [Chryseobacterium group]MBV6880960.1 efflux RND transporter periplasmic adaptor subunit [Epilithonimonas sp. FP105]MDW8549849.1 efflux RND transporter periplasmic adaptor subunit [Epilithonimonas ginsengisoli]
MRTYIYSGLILSAVLLSSCSSDDKKSVQNTDAPISVTVNQSTTNSTGSSATATGKLVARNSVNVSTRMMGYITSMRGEVGQNVTAGQALVSINSTDIQAKGGQANAQISQAQAGYNIAKKDYERFQNLYKNQSASQKELDDMRARYEMAQAGLQAAQQMKNEVNSQYKYTNITAPISGTITAKFAEQGDMASPGMPLLTIESSGSLQAQVLVSEKDITMITQGMSVQVTLKSINKTVSGTVSEISKSATNTGGQYMVKINIPASKELLPGMFVNVQFPFKNSGKTNQDFQENIMIPKSALVENGQLTGVYVVSSQNAADIECKGLFLNADSGFDSKKLRDMLYKKEIIGNIKGNPRNRDTKNEKYFDNELYKRRFKIEKANAWLDSFKALLVRFETLNITWTNLHYLAFSILFLRKIKV